MTNTLFKKYLSLTAATVCLAGTAVTTAQADDPVSLSANVAVVSDYRFRGISMTDKDIAIQGGLDVATESGFYIGTWGSSLETYAGSQTELDIYGGYATEIGGLTYDIGILAYTYPGSNGTTYWEPYASVSGTAGSLGWKLGAAYALDQASIGDTDNIYIYLDGEMPLGDSGFSAAGHIAYEDGAFGDNKWDWNLGVSYAFDQFSVGVAYVDTNVEDLGSATAVISLGASF